MVAIGNRRYTRDQRALQGSSMSTRQMIVARRFRDKNRLPSKNEIGDAS